MRITALYVAIVLLAASLLSRHWAAADVGNNRIEVGARDFVEYSGGVSDVDPLHELNGMGMGFEHKGLAALVAGIAAALACAVASAVMRRRELSLLVRIAFVVPLAGSFIASCVFAKALAGLRYLDLGWSLYACLGAVLLAAAAILMSSKVAR